MWLILWILNHDIQSTVKSSVQETSHCNVSSLVPSAQQYSHLTFLRQQRTKHETSMHERPEGEFDLRPCPEEETCESFNKRYLVLPSIQAHSHVTFIRQLKSQTNEAKGSKSGVAFDLQSEEQQESVQRCLVDPRVQCWATHRPINPLRGKKLETDKLWNIWCFEILKIL